MEKSNGILESITDEVVKSILESIFSALELLNMIFIKGLESAFPQIYTSGTLRLLIVAPKYVASGERGFSKLTLIKNRLWSTRNGDRQNNLIRLSI